MRVEVRVHVDKTRGDVRAPGVDLLATPVGHGADRGDPVAVDGDIGRDARRTGAVDHRSVPDDEIVHAAEPKACGSRR